MKTLKNYTVVRMTLPKEVEELVQQGYNKAAVIVQGNTIIARLVKEDKNINIRDVIEAAEKALEELSRGQKSKELQQDTPTQKNEQLLSNQSQK